ncbi:hypothetical protein CSOJ01_02675 [Colletotrichum sojae]|uniref:Uncharacterized protein n=1 Tax=Colletotrichum sojae TaxID=2175907 RepID=A0A8H6N2C1_9PEZI|nr:hypothetical protein CSOJ01_02675 [Colletotrichum sojae]
MSCGHILRCRQNCENSGCKNTAVRRRFLNDSCAECHVPMLLGRNRAAYEDLHAGMTAKYMRAKRCGDEAGMATQSHNMLELARLARILNFEVGLTRGEPSGEVLWPREDEGEETDSNDKEQDGKDESGGGQN